jgi:hypothetical protein
MGFPFSRLLPTCFSLLDGRPKGGKMAKKGKRVTSKRGAVVWMKSEPLWKQGRPPKAQGAKLEVEPKNSEK